MQFHEKTLELNITHELLNLADCWHWFLTDSPLWKYWNPKYRLPILRFPKSTSAGFHITTEGKNDPTGNSGGGFDVRIKSGVGKNLLFIQYKKGDLVLSSPDPKSEFHKVPHDHFKFKINSKSTNQHFTLRDLANGIGQTKGNAVVYALPLIADINELEKNAGKLIRKTKFISILDIDLQAACQKPPVEFKKNSEHNFRVGKFDINRCEVNYYYFFFSGKDRTSEIITDIIIVKFRKILFNFIRKIKKYYNKHGLVDEEVLFQINYSFIRYTKYLLQYFEVSPSKLNISFLQKNAEYYENEFTNYESSERDIEILKSVFSELEKFENFINNSKELSEREIPQYESKFLLNRKTDEFTITFKDEDSRESIEEMNYLIF